MNLNVCMALWLCVCAFARACVCALALANMLTAVPARAGASTLVLLTRCSRAGESNRWWGNVLCVRDSERAVHERLLDKCRWLGDA